MYHNAKYPFCIDVTSAEYCDMMSNIFDLSRRFDLGGAKRGVRLQVSSVYHIEQHYLWRHYETVSIQFAHEFQRKVIPKHSPSFVSKQLNRTVHINSDLNEMLVFHGTKPNIVPIILKEGFDPRVGSLEGKYGAG